MAGILPIVVKKWLYATVANPLTGTNIGNQKAMAIAWKNQRKTFGHVIAGSGNTAAGAMDGVDRLNVIGDFTDGTRGNWWVFKQPGSSAQDCFSYNNFGQPNWRHEHSPGGLFTGGSNTVLPTATDGSGSLFVGADGGLFFGDGFNGGGNPQFVCNMWCSTDLTCFRSSFWIGGNPFGMIWYDAINKPVSGWAKPNVAALDKLNNSITTNEHIGWFNNYVLASEVTGNGMFKGQGPHGLMNMAMTAEGTAPNPFRSMSDVGGRLKNKISGFYEMPDFPPGIYEVIGHADGGRHGRFFDVWIIPGNDNVGTTFATGSTVPLDGSKQFVVIGDLMLPWNGTAFRTT